jgi:hypothetical protein
VYCLTTELGISYNLRVWPDCKDKKSSLPHEGRVVLSEHKTGKKSNLLESTLVLKVIKVNNKYR